LRINELSSASSSQTITCGVLFCICLRLLSQDGLLCVVNGLFYHLYSSFVVSLFLKTSLEGAGYVVCKKKNDRTDGI
jgi:hypothetical protein